MDWGIGNRQMGGQFNYLKEGGAGGSAAQSVDCFSNLHKAWGRSLEPNKPGVVTHTWHPSTWTVEAGGSVVQGQGHPGLLRKFAA